MHILKIIGHRRSLQLVGLLILDVIFFGNTDTSKVPAYVLIIGFVLFMLSSYTLIYYLLSFLKLYGLPFKNKKRLSLYLCGLISMLVALQSIGELSPKDVLVLLPLAFIGYVYSTYARVGRAEN